MSKFLGGVLQGNETVFLTQDEINNPYADIPTMIEDKKRKQVQMKQTLFHRITASPETLAPKLVYVIKQLVTISGTSRENPGGYKVKTKWFSTIIVDDFDSEAAAIAATVAKLKEEAE